MMGHINITCIDIVNFYIVAFVSCKRVSFRVYNQALADKKYTLYESAL